MNQVTGFVTKYGSKSVSLCVQEGRGRQKDSQKCQKALETYIIKQEKKYLVNHIVCPKLHLISPWEAVFLLVLFPSVLINKLRTPAVLLCSNDLYGFI